MTLSIAEEKATSAITAPTQFIATQLETYAYRRFGEGAGLPLLCLQHFTGTLDNWDPAVTDPLAQGREVILFESAGIGRSTGEVPKTVAEMAAHALAFIDALGLTQIDVLGYSLGGMVAQVIVLERPTLVRRLMLVATAPEGGEDIMHMEKPELRKFTEDPKLPGLQRLVGLFFTPSAASQAAGQAFAVRLALRTEDREPASGPAVAGAQIAAFRDWEQVKGERFARLARITQPCLVVNGVHDNMIPVRNSYFLSEHLPNAALLTFPDAGHGGLFQYHELFVREARLFLDADLPGSVDAIRHTTVATGLTYPALVAAFERELDRFDPGTGEAFAKRGAPWSEVQAEIARVGGRHGLMILGQANQGPLISLSGDTSQCSLYLVGNPVVAQGIISIDARAAFYVPFRVCLFDDGGAGGASISFDRPSSFLATLGRPELTEVGIMLDQKIDGVVAAITKRS